MNEARKSLLASLRDQATRIEQAIARDEYLGHEAEVSDVRREVQGLAIILEHLLDALAEGERVNT